MGSIEQNDAEQMKKFGYMRKSGREKKWENFFLGFKKYNYFKKLNKNMYVLNKTRPCDIENTICSMFFSD